MASNNNPNICYTQVRYAFAENFERNAFFVPKNSFCPNVYVVCTVNWQCSDIDQ